MTITSQERIQELIDIEYEKALEDIMCSSAEVDEIIESISSDIARLYILHQGKQKVMCNAIMQQIDEAVREEAELRAREQVYD